MPPHRDLPVSGAFLRAQVLGGAVRRRTVLPRAVRGRTVPTEVLRSAIGFDLPGSRSSKAGPPAAGPRRARRPDRRPPGAGPCGGAGGWRSRKRSNPDYKNEPDHGRGAAVDTNVPSIHDEQRVHHMSIVLAKNLFTDFSDTGPGAARPPLPAAPGHPTRPGPGRRPGGSR